MDKKIKEIKILKDIYFKGHWFRTSGANVYLYASEDEPQHAISNGPYVYCFGEDDLEFWLSGGFIEVVYEEEEVPQECVHDFSAIDYNSEKAFTYTTLRCVKCGEPNPNLIATDRSKSPITKDHKYKLPEHLNLDQFKISVHEDGSFITDYRYDLALKLDQIIGYLKEREGK